MLPPPRPAPAALAGAPAPRPRPKLDRLLLAAAALRPAGGFYLPGVAPIEYEAKGQVDLKVNKLTSVKTQLPYGYYTLPYCKPLGGIKHSVENLGEILTGDLIENSPYEIYMNVNGTCQVLCIKELTPEDQNEFRNKIDDDYLVNWIVDNLPAAMRYVPAGAGSTQAGYVTAGFPVGGILPDGRYFVYNHMKFYFKFHRSPGEYEGFRIVGFEVEPQSLSQSVREEAIPPTASCEEPIAAKLFDLETYSKITFTYDVFWNESPHRWASRWDIYLNMSAGEIHWFSILNSIMIILFLSGMVAMILMRTLYRDITKYNELATAEEAAEETGWKLVHGDVFRKPKHAKLLAASVGSGVQLLGMSVVTLVFALLGFLSPAHRGGVLQSMMLLFTFMGVFGGYVNSRLYKVFHGDDWKTSTILMATFYPGIVFAIFFVLNLFIWGQKSSGAVPFTTMFAILVLWFGISVPLVFLGSHVGFRRTAIELPVRTNQVPRQIPAQRWYARSDVTALSGGILPFGAVFTELFFILSSLWQHQFYYLFGFLALVLVILLITCAEISIALTYFQLTAENYQWWWRSFFASGTSGFYVFVYSIVYFRSRLQIDKFVSIMLYFGYMTIMSMGFFLMTGSIGTLATFYFVKVIYGSIKVD